MGEAGWSLSPRGENGESSITFLKIASGPGWVFGDFDDVEKMRGGEAFTAMANQESYQSILPGRSLSTSFDDEEEGEGRVRCGVGGRNPRSPSSSVSSTFIGGFGDDMHNLVPSSPNSSPNSTQTNNKSFKPLRYFRVTYPLGLVVIRAPREQVKRMLRRGSSESSVASAPAKMSSPGDGGGSDRSIGVGDYYQSFNARSRLTAVVKKLSIPFLVNSRTVDDDSDDDDEDGIGVIVNGVGGEYVNDQSVSSHHNNKNSKTEILTLNYVFECSAVITLLSANKLLFQLSEEGEGGGYVEIPGGGKGMRVEELDEREGFEVVERRRSELAM